MDLSSTLDLSQEVSNYEEMWDCLKLNKIFRLGKNWRDFSSINLEKCAKSASDITYEYLRIICDVCGQSKTLESFHFRNAFPVQDERMTQEFECFAELISKTSSIKKLLLIDFEFTMSEANSISVAIEKNRSIQILDIYTEATTNGANYCPIIDGISQNPTLRIVSFPIVANSSLTEFINHLNKLISSQSPCRIQVLDILALDWDYGKGGNEIDLFRSICTTLEDNTSLHTLIIGWHTLGKAMPFYQLINQLLDKNFTLRNIGDIITFFSFTLDNSVACEIEKKLKRNEKIFWMKGLFKYFYSLRLIALSHTDKYFDYFPLELVHEIFSFYTEVEFLRWENEMIERHGVHYCSSPISYLDGSPFSFNDIY